MKNRTNNFQVTKPLEVFLSVPSPVWRKICKAGKREKFLDVVALQGETFIFNIEEFCEHNGIELSKHLRALCDQVADSSGKFFKPRLLPSVLPEGGKN